jgi:hypothetical protein
LIEQKLEAISNKIQQDAVEILTRQLERYRPQEIRAKPSSKWQEVIQDITFLRVPSLNGAPVFSQGSSLIVSGLQAPTETKEIRTSIEHENFSDSGYPSQPNWRFPDSQVPSMTVVPTESIAPRDITGTPDLSNAEQIQFVHGARDLMNNLNGTLVANSLEGSMSPLTLTELSAVVNEIQVGTFSAIYVEDTVDNVGPLFIEETRETRNETDSPSTRLLDATPLLTQRATRGSLSRKRKRLYSAAKNFEERRVKLQNLGPQWLSYWEEVSNRDVANVDRMWEILVLIPVLGNGQFFSQLRKVLKTPVESRHKVVECNEWQELYACYTHAETVAHDATMRLLCWKMCIHREMIKRGKILEQEREKGLKPRNGNDRNVSEVIDDFVSHFTGMELEFVRKNRADQIAHRRRVQLAKKLGVKFDKWEGATNIPWTLLPISNMGSPLDESALISKSR